MITTTTSCPDLPFLVDVSIEKRCCDRREAERICERLARRQYGVVSRRQLLEAGMSRHAINRRLATGRLIVVFPRVYVLAGVPPSAKQSLMAAVLWAGPRAVISHRGAAFLWELDGFGEPVVEVTVLRGSRAKRPGIILHGTDRLPGCDVTSLGPLPVTDPARTLVDLGAVVAEVSVELALEDALRRGLTSVARLRWRVAELCRNGRRGCAAINRLLDARPSRVATGSPLETRLGRLLAHARLPAPVRQHEVRDCGRLVARVDFAYPNQKIAIEVDGYAYHSGRARWEADLARRNMLAALGWRIVHVTAEQMRAPDEVVSTIARFLSM